jgi:hypothetical protein
MCVPIATGRSLVLAFTAQVLEGLSVDNLFHFHLNAAYVETASDDGQVSRLFALSLGLFMARIAHRHLPHLCRRHDESGPSCKYCLLRRGELRVSGQASVRGREWRAQTRGVITWFI